MPEGRGTPVVFESRCLPNSGYLLVFGQVDVRLSESWQHANLSQLVKAPSSGIQNYHTTYRGAANTPFLLFLPKTISTVAFGYAPATWILQCSVAPPPPSPPYVPATVWSTTLHTDFGMAPRSYTNKLLDHQRENRLAQLLLPDISRSARRKGILSPVCVLCRVEWHQLIARSWNRALSPVPDSTLVDHKYWIVCISLCTR